MKKHSRVFISYRREGGAEMARLIRDSLRERGYNVFMDVEDLRSGPFNTALFKQIETSTDVVVVLTPFSLDRCIDENDWLRLEVAHAIKCKRNVVPVMTRGFEWPSESLPDDLRELPEFNGLAASHDYFEASMNRLAELLVGQPKLRPHLTGPMLAALVVVALVCIAVAFLASSWSGRKPPPPTTLTPSPESANLVHLSPVDEAKKLFDAKDYAGAFHTYSQASDLDLNNISLHRNIEQCARRGGLTQQFLERYRKLVQQEPNRAVLRNYLGNALLVLDPNDSEDKAQAEYREAIRLDGQFSSPLMNLGIIAFRRDKYAKAEDLFNRYLKLDPQDAMGWTNLGLLYTTQVEADANDVKAVDNGLAALDKALQLDPGLALTYKSRGRILAATGHKTEALRAFQLSLALDYEQPEVRRQFELLAWDLGTDRLIMGTSDDMQTRSLRGAQTLSIMKALDHSQFDQAEQECRKLTSQDPENPLAWQLLAQAIRGLGHVVEAQEVSNKARSLAIVAE